MISLGQAKAATGTHGGLFEGPVWWGFWRISLTRLLQSLIVWRANTEDGAGRSS